jgi:hypothetical protein
LRTGQPGLLAGGIESYQPFWKMKRGAVELCMCACEYLKLNASVDLRRCARCRAAP